MSGTNIPMLLLNSWKWYIESAVVDVGTALPSTLLRTVSLSNRVAVRLGVRTGTNPVPTQDFYKKGLQQQPLPVCLI